MIHRNIFTLTLAGALFASPFAHADERPASIFVHVNGEHATLEGTSADGTRVVCEAPCDRKLPATYEYRATAEVQKPSRPFTLFRDSQSVAVDVAGGSRAAHGAGIALFILGSSGAFASSLLLSEGIANQTWQRVLNAPDTTHDWIAYSSVALGASAVTAVVGLLLWTLNHKTTVTQRVMTN